MQHDLYYLDLLLYLPALVGASSIPSSLFSPRKPWTAKEKTYIWGSLLFAHSRDFKKKKEKNIVTIFLIEQEETFMCVCPMCPWSVSGFDFLMCQVVVASGCAVLWGTKHTSDVSITFIWKHSRFHLCSCSAHFETSVWNKAVRVIELWVHLRKMSIETIYHS